ncbi:Transmembrane domain-containing protein [Orpheovirus IHUMI-LCC2]|uniref:Transmembrane domain-containing protein n=1 Tax=Orpheovirus IHUMI-LCC2 TaxID=2023057 RepID=A0A2I2L4A1_9VIRU|nr:Transmembrane domain-containing protein [Orpheovirus IHUMI-LCC2]SNW62341.1 Transmembrane domain-containing protein [Orpheovirus IHUMI-LCC2]
MLCKKIGCANASIWIISFIGITILSFWVGYALNSLIISSNQSNYPSYNCTILDIPECISNIRTISYKVILDIPNCGNTTINYNKENNGTNCSNLRNALLGTHVTYHIDNCQIVFSNFTFSLLVFIIIISLFISSTTIAIIIFRRSYNREKLYKLSEDISYN